MTLSEEVRADRRAACKLPDRLTPSEWAEKNRILTAAVSAEPGPWRNSRTPYLVGIMNSVCEPGVEETVFVACTQVGKSEAIRNVIGWEIDEDPGPCLYVMPTEASVKEALEERIKPLLVSSPSLKSHVSSDPHDITQSAVKLDSMSIYFGWSNSPQSLATRPCRRVKFDEVDKYPAFAGREADPISLGEERTATYGHRRHKFKVSTPTTREGAIWRAWEACGDRRHYYVPCPHCGRFQVLAFPQVKWPKFPEGTEKVAAADKVENDRLAWYECANPSCKGIIRDHHKPKMLGRGLWVSEGQTVADDGAVSGEKPRSKRVGFHLNAIYSPWRSFSDVAAQFIRADGDPGATMNFRNSWLAEPFEQQVSKREPVAIRVKVEQAKARGLAGRRRVVPSWAVLLHATVDVQQGYTWWQISAWGYGLQSKVIDDGTSNGGGQDDAAVLRALEATYMEVFNPQFPLVMDTGVPISVNEMYVDAKYKKAVVTQFAQRDPRRVFLTEGSSAYTGPIATPKVEKVSGVVVWSINTMQSKDTLDRLIGDPDPDKWQVHDETSDMFCTHMAGEHKIIDPHTRRMIWTKKTSGSPNHQWDNSANAAAIAAAKGAAMPAPAPQPAQPQQSTTADSPAPSSWQIKTW